LHLALALLLAAGLRRSRHHAAGLALAGAPRASDGATTDEPDLDVFARQPDGGWKIIRYLAYEE
jgi:hypothetical protein